MRSLRFLVDGVAKVALGKISKDELNGLTSEIELHFRSEMKLKARFIELSTQELSFFLYNLGKLTGDIRDKVPAWILGSFLDELAARRDADSKMIASAFYGLGLLAKSGCLRGTLDKTYIESLLTRLISIRPTAQCISNTLYGLGLLAKSDCLRGMLNKSRIESLLTHLVSDNPGEQGMSNSLYGLGMLAQSGCLRGMLDKSRIESLLTRLVSSRPSEQEISNTLYGLSLLAKSDCLRGVLSKVCIEKLLDGLDSGRPSAQEISNVLYGLGLLAKSDCLRGALDKACVESLLTRLISGNPSEQCISNTLYGVGLLAKSDCLRWVLSKVCIKKLLGGLDSGRPSAQEISNTLYGLGLLAKSDCLRGALDKARVESLLTRLVSENPSAQEISNTLYGLGLLAKSDCLRDALDKARVESLLTRLVSENPSAQEISNTLYGLGLLAKSNCLRGVLSKVCIEKLLDGLVSGNPVAQEISNTLYGLGLLCQANVVIDLEVGPVLNHLSVRGLEDVTLVQILLGLSGLNYEGVAHLNRIFSVFSERSYLHPSQALVYLECFARLLQNNALDIMHFKTLLGFLSHYKLNQFNASSQDCLYRILELLSSSTPALRECLALEFGIQSCAPSVEIAPVIPEVGQDDFGFNVSASRPVANRLSLMPASPSISVSYHGALERSQIFCLIAKKSLKKLEDLLGVSSLTPRPSSQTPKSSSHRTAFFMDERRQSSSGVSRVDSREERLEQKNNAYVLVREFLNHTERGALQHLIAHSSYDYFERLLRACGKHEQYQFAIHHSLHPILLHLPLQELQKFILALEALGFYRDHRAVLYIVDALDLRKLFHLEESATLFKEQEFLMSKAIEYHSQHHRHVSGVLKEAHSSLGVQARKIEDNAEASECRVVLESSSMDIVPNTERGIQPFVEESLMASQDGSPNMKAYYSSETIQVLLRIRLTRRHSDFVLLGGVNVQNDEVGELLSNLDEHLKSEQAVGDDFKVIFPIRVQRGGIEHWVGLKIERRGHALSLVYYDSLSQENDVLPLRLKSAFEECFSGCRVELSRSNTYKQEDGTSCGAYLVENIMRDLGDALKKGSAEAFRAFHLSNLQEEEPAYYQKHLDLLPQAENPQSSNDKKRKYNDGGLFGPSSNSSGISEMPLRKKPYQEDSYFRGMIKK
jgi:hypothetical protein